MSNLEPKLPPLLVSKTHEKYAYVMTYSNQWDPVSKRSKRTNSKKVGKLNLETGLITFDSEFLDEYPELNDLLVYKIGTGKGSKYKFVKKIENEINLILSKIKETTKLHGGATWVLDQIVKDSPIGRALQKCFPEKNQAKKILSLAYFLVLNRDNAVYNYEEFAECTKLPFQKPLNSTQVNRLFTMISENNIESFFSLLDEEFTNNLNDAYEPTYLALDSTSISTYSKKISAADFGHNKDGDDTPQVNVLFLTEQKSGLPLYYRTYDGAVPDISTLRNVIASRARLKLNNDVVFVSDKGYMSSKNIDDCLRNNVHFLFNCKINSNGKNFIQSCIDEHLNDLVNTNNKVLHLNQYVVSDKITWKYDSFPVQGKRASYKDSVELFVHFYYDDNIKKQAFDNFTDRLCSIKERYNNNEEISPEDNKIVQNFMDISSDGKARINMAKQNEHLKYCGIRVLISDVVSCPIKAHQAYDNRNTVEYAFNTLKSRLKCNRLRCHGNASLRGKIFVQIIACSIAIMIRNRIAEYNKTATDKNEKFRLIYDSDHKVLAKLNNIMVTQFHNGYYFDEVVGYKKDLFKALNVDLPTASFNNDDLIEDDTENTSEEKNFYSSNKEIL